jgi:SNF2 family DNA or RNA helicase
MVSSCADLPMMTRLKGVAWMLGKFVKGRVFQRKTTNSTCSARERTADMGGIMADEMGLGKTVQMSVWYSHYPSST